MRKCKIPERGENELRKWDEIVEKALDKFHTFWWLKHVKMDYETYLTYTLYISDKSFEYQKGLESA